MTYLIGHRPAWVRVLLVPGQAFSEAIGIPLDEDGLSPDYQITDPVSMRFDAGLQHAGGDPAQPEVVTEWVIPGDQLPDGTVVFRLAAEGVNQLVNDIGSGSRRVRVTIGDIVWGAGYFEIDGEW